MSLYELFNINQDSSPYDIETAGKSALRRLNIINLKNFLKLNNINYNEEDINFLLNNMRRYVNCSASLLLEPSTKDCYDNILTAKTPEIQTLAKARVSYLNAKGGYVKFDESIYEQLPLANELPSIKILNKKRKKCDLSCRWCRKPFELDKYMIYQCKCSARIGHVGCADKFAKEYKNKCPVCRGMLLKRYTISKYMFWGIDKKFKI